MSEETSGFKEVSNSENVSVWEEDSKSVDVSVSDNVSVSEDKVLS